MGGTLEQSSEGSLLGDVLGSVEGDMLGMVLGIADGGSLGSGAFGQPGAVGPKDAPVHKDVGSLVVTPGPPTFASQKLLVGKPH